MPDPQPTKVIKVPTGFKFKAPGEGGKEYYEQSLSAPPAIQGSVQNVGFNKKFLIDQLSKGVSPDSLVKAGHASSSGITPFLGYYKPKMVYTEPEPKVTQPIPIKQGLNVDRQIVPNQNTNYTTYNYPDPNAGYSKSTQKHFVGEQEIDPSQSYDSTGKFVPKFIGGQTVNQGANLGTVKQDVSRVTSSPLINDVSSTDYLGTPTRIQGGQDVRNTNTNLNLTAKDYQPKKKGGLVGKVRGYENGGEIQYDSTGKPISVLPNGNPGIGQNTSVDPNNTQTNLGTGQNTVISNPNPPTGLLKQVPNITQLQSQQKTGNALNDALTSSSQGANTGMSLGTTKAGMGAGAGIGAAVGLIGDVAPKLIDAKTQDVYGRYDTGSKTGDYFAGIGSGAIKGGAKGAALGSALGPMGMAIGAGIGGLAAEIQGGIKVKKDRQSIQDEKDAIELAKNSSNQKKVWDNAYNTQMQNRAQGLADGGKVVGKGTGTSDSIKAKIRPGSFVVPKKNVNQIEKILGDKKEEKAELVQPNGENVRLSNGEFVLTPEEYKELKSQGYDVDALAPNSDDKKEMKNGGLTSEKAKEILRDGTANGKKLTPLQMRYMGWAAGGSKADGGMVEGYAEGGEITGDDLQKYIKEKIRAKAEGRVEPTLPTYKKAPSIKTVKKVANANGLNVEDMKQLSPKVAEAMGNVVPLQTNPNAIVPTVNSNSVNLDTSKNINNYNPQSDTGSSVNNKQLLGLLGQGRDMANGLLNYVVPYKQTRMGLDYLAKSGARPVDTVDSGFQGSVNKANANAQFGFTPEEQALLNQNNLGQLNANKNAARNYSGGSGGNAYNMERDASNQFYGRGLEGLVAGRKLQLGKQEYADQMNMAKADKMRQLFGDKMNAFQQNQLAGQNLVGAGLSNAIGAQRYQQELDAMKKANNVTVNYGGQ